MNLKYLLVVLLLDKFVIVTMQNDQIATSHVGLFKTSGPSIGEIDQRLHITSSNVEMCVACRSSKIGENVEKSATRSFTTSLRRSA